MTPRFKMFCDIAKVRNQPNHAEFNQIPETQNSVHKNDVHREMIHPTASQCQDLRGKLTRYRLVQGMILND